jgi:aminoglycoside phosphotransferase
MAPIPRDEALPALHELLSDEGRGLIGSLAAERGLRLLSVRIAQIRYEPGRSVVVQFRTQVAGDGGSPADETWVATAGTDAPDGLPVFAIRDTTVSLWRYPDDPYLPGLAAAADPARIASILHQLGADPGHDLRIRRRSYRPGRRAVLEVQARPYRLFVKVVRPARVAALQQRHERMAEHIAVPQTLGWSNEFGIVALQAMPGQTLRSQLEAGLRQPPSGSALMRLLDALPSIDGARSVAGPIDRLATHARLITAVLPEARERLDRLAERIGEGEQEAAVPVHGDFHSSQLLVDASAVVGLIDVDTSGMGHRSNDLAVLLAHLATVGLGSRNRRNITRYGRELLAVFEQGASAADLRRRVAAAIVGFATGPFRVQLANWPEETAARLGVAERWLET